MSREERDESDDAPVTAALASCSLGLQGNDREFCGRVWSTPVEVYEDRIRAIGFAGRQVVLDAGCGMGQWTYALARLNQQVVAIDFDDSRVRTTRCMMTALGIDNVVVQRASIDVLPVPTASVDAVFCYSVIMMADHEEALAEFFRVLRPGGQLYICANGLGHYLANIVAPRNSSPSYDARAVAIAAIRNTLDWALLGQQPDGQRMLPSAYLAQTALTCGFTNTVIQAEGTFQLPDTPKPTPFYPPSEFGLENVYELICVKPRGRPDAS